MMMPAPTMVGAATHFGALGRLSATQAAAPEAPAALCTHLTHPPCSPHLHSCTSHLTPVCHAAVGQAYLISGMTDLTEMTDRRMSADPRSKSKGRGFSEHSAPREDTCGAIATARAMTAPPYAGWVRMLSADLQQQARQRRLVGGELERQESNEL